MVWHFRETLRRLAIGPRAHLAVAVSGGADSMALSWMLAADRGAGFAFMVDHGLRSASADEARHVGKVFQEHAVLSKLTLETVKIEWDETPVTRIQERSREKRYAVLEELCRKHGIEYLLTGHHLHDQMETVLMRFNHGSGILGMAGIAATRPLCPHNPVTLVRPLLDVPKEDLIALCSKEGISWVEDPSNQMERFERVRARQDIADWKRRSGKDIQECAAIFAQMQTMGRRMKARVDHVCQRTILDPSLGVAFLPLSSMEGFTQQEKVEALSAVIRVVGGKQYPPRSAASRELLMRLGKNASTFKILLNVFHLYIAVQSRGGQQSLIFMNQNMPVSSKYLGSIESSVDLSSEHGVVWDQRYRIVLENPTKRVFPVHIKPLRKQMVAHHPVLRHHPNKALFVHLGVPTIVSADQRRVLAVPHADFYTNKCPTYRVFCLDSKRAP